MAFAGFYIAGAIDGPFLHIAALCVPCTLAGTLIGLRLYARVNDRQFRRIVLGLVGVSGVVLVVQTVAG